MRIFLYVFIVAILAGGTYVFINNQKESSLPVVEYNEGVFEDEQSSGGAQENYEDVDMQGLNLTGAEVRIVKPDDRTRIDTSGRFTYEVQTAPGVSEVRVFITASKVSNPLAPGDTLVDEAYVVRNNKIINTVDISNSISEISKINISVESWVNSPVQVNTFDQMEKHFDFIELQVSETAVFLKDEIPDSMARNGDQTQGFKILLGLDYSQLIFAAEEFFKQNAPIMFTGGKDAEERFDAEKELTQLNGPIQGEIGNIARNQNFFEEGNVDLFNLENMSDFCDHSKIVFSLNKFTQKGLNYECKDSDSQMRVWVEVPSDSSLVYCTNENEYFDFNPENNTSRSFVTIKRSLIDDDFDCHIEQHIIPPGIDIFSLFY